MTDEFTIRDHRKPGHYRIDTLLIKGGYAKALGVYGLGVYNVLACYADNDTQEAHPSYRKIAELLDCSRRQVIRAIGDLQAGNLIVVIERRREDGSRTSNEIILIDKEEWKPSAAISEHKKPQGSGGGDSESLGEVVTDSHQGGDSESQHDLDSEESNPNHGAETAPMLAEDQQNEVKKQLRVLFTELTNIKPTKSQVKAFNRSYREMAEEFGPSAPDLMRRAWQEAKTNSFTVTKPQSLFSTMNRLRCQPPPPRAVPRFVPEEPDEADLVDLETVQQAISQMRKGLNYGHP